MLSKKFKKKIKLICSALSEVCMSTLISSFQVKDSIVSLLQVDRKEFEVSVLCLFRLCTSQEYLPANTNSMGVKCSLIVYSTCLCSVLLIGKKKYFELKLCHE